MSYVFGAVDNALICGFVLAPGRPGRPIGLAEALTWLGQIQQQPEGLESGADEFIWLHFNLTDTTAEKWMQANLSLPPEFFEALREGSRSTRIEDASDNLIAVVNDVAFEFSFDPSEIASLWVNVSARVVVSARVHPLRSIDRLRQAVKDGARFASSVELLNHLMDDQGDVLVRIVREATLQVDSIEDGLLVGRLQQKRGELGKLRRVLVRLQRLLAPEPGALFRLLRQPPPWVKAHDLEELRQATEEFSLVIRDLSALQERIKLLQEEMVAQVGEQTNRSVFTLTVVTVLALPINIMAGLFGMNVGGVPLSEHPHGFGILALVVLGFTAVAAWAAFRKKD